MDGLSLMETSKGANAGLGSVFWVLLGFWQLAQERASFA